MADEKHQSAFQSSPPMTWGRSPHIYPHSHHGTPAQEYSNFSFGSPQISLPSSTFETSMSQRPIHQQLQPLVMPQWPSMLNSQSHSSFQPTYPQPVQPIQPMALAPLPTPVSATSTRSASTPRKTLTDLDRKAMCQYAEDNPTAKQTEIGARFGVERRFEDIVMSESEACTDLTYSTVSKVLRQKEKYLFQDDGSRSPAKRPKGRSPDIERALAVWAKNQEKKGIPLSDDSIRQKAQAFSATSSNPDAQAAMSTSWLEKFKFKNNLMGARSRKSSLAPDDADDASFTASASHTPNNASPNSQHTLSSPSAEELHGVNSHESMNMERTEAYTDFRGAQFHSQSQSSLNSAFTEAPSSFSPAPLSPTSPFFTPDSAMSASPFMPQSLRQTHTVPSNAPNVNNNVNPASKPRSQTFPLLDHYMSDTTINGSTAEPPTPKYVASSMLDSPLQELTDPLPNLNSAVQGMHTEGVRQHTMTPSEMMRPPPLPSNMSAPRSMTPSSISNLSAATSPEEARKAMEVVLSFFEQQPNGYLDLQESITVGKLMEKLKLQARAS
ncbi:hypothetical protein Q7P37_004027 [Cladosporium fusiforme]